MRHVAGIVAATVVVSTALTLRFVGVAAEQTAPSPSAAAATMRIDVVHTGGRGAEIFAVDRIVIEPLPWPGHPARAVDTSNAGAWRFELREPGGRLLYSRGYSSIFGEWVTTAEAASTHRSFHESLRFPLPTAPVRVIVQRRNAAQAFETAWETQVDPADAFIDRALPPPQHLIALEEHGAPADKVDLLLLGDGYTAGECGTTFTADARRMIDALFRHEPFRTRRADFNVWGLCPPSAQSGVSRPSNGVYRRTPVGATYDAFGLERYVLTFDNRALRDVAAWAPYEFMTILVNAETTAAAGSSARSRPWPRTATGRRITCSSTSSPIISPGSPTSTTPRRSPTSPQRGSSSPGSPT